jgi:putative transposase
MRYRRAIIEGATYFFTVNLADRSRRLLVERVADLREVVRTVRQRHPFEILAWCVLPEHLHAVWTLPPGDANYAMRWSLIKAGFSRCIPQGECIRHSRIMKGERGIWQRRYWEHVIRDDHDLARHIDYTHFNPVKHGYVQMVRDWPYSSFHAYVRKGWLSEDWGYTGVQDGDFGEDRRLG